MDDRRGSRLRRLADAVDIYLSQRDRPEAEVEATLARNGELRDLLEPMFQGATGGHDAARFGDFRLLREIGRGGMGVVFEAEELALGRRVALKVLPPDAVVGPRTIERFRREAAAVAKLNHPGIVPIYRVGDVDGTHYFAMELVAGRDLGQALDAVRQTAAPTLGLAGAASYADEAAEVVAQAADALAAAHAQGVLHRDIKPHNILLQADGRVRVVDFGLAKDLDRGSISHTGEIAGTPHYMSPEQAAGERDLDGRTDVFALGVVLYELLTFTLPFDADSTPAVLYAIRTREPVAPRRLRPGLPRDLETICLRAIEKDPRRRYASCAALAADLRRFLSREPIEARARGPVTRVFKLVRRNKALAAAIALGLVASIGGPLAWWLVQRQAQADLGVQRAAVRRQRDLAHRLVEQQLARVEQLARAPGMELVQRQLAEDALAYHQEFLGGDDTDPALRSEAIDALVLVGRLRRQLGELEAARAAFDEAVRMAGDGEDGEDASLLVSRLGAAAAQAACQASQGQLEASLATFARAQALADAALATRTGPAREAVAVAAARLWLQAAASSLERREDMASVRAALARATALWAEAPNEANRPENQIEQLTLDRRRGEFLNLTREHAEADAVLSAAVGRAEALVAANAGDPVFRAVLGQVLSELGGVLSNMPDASQRAEATLRRAITVREALVADFPRQLEHRNGLHVSLHNLALHLMWKGRHAEAMDIASRARDILTELLAASPNDTRLIRYVLNTANTIGLIGQEVWSPERLEAHYAATITTAREQLARFPDAVNMHSSYGAMLNNLALWHIRHGNNAAAEPLLAEAVEHQRVAHQRAPGVSTYGDFLGNHLRQLVRTRIALGRPDQALGTARELAVMSTGNAGAEAAAAEWLVRIGQAKGIPLTEPQSDDDPAHFYDEPAALLLQALARQPSLRGELAKNAALAALGARRDCAGALRQTTGR